MKSLFFIVSAPSGTGKTSICKEVIKDLPEISYSVSYTTRKPRPGEEESKDYFFVSPEKFQEMIEKDLFVEWTEIYGNCYGTSKAMVKKLIDEGKDILFDVDIKGAKKILELYPESITIFILPPSLEELRERLNKRGADEPASISSRLKLAEKEIKDAEFYQYQVVNDSFEDAVQKIKEIIINERLKKERCKGVLNSEIT